LVIVAGGFDRDTAEAWLQQHKADLIAFGRKFLANPDLPDRFCAHKPMIHPRIMAAGRRAIPTIRPLRRHEASNRRPVWTTDGNSAQVLAFYPADWSPVCGDQMALYNEVLPEFHKHDAEVLGISVDAIRISAFSVDPGAPERGTRRRER
jgi:hypothetical protein